MNARSLTLAIRAISAEFAQRLYIPALIFGVVAIILLLGLSTYLVTMSAWWWLLLAPLILLSATAFVAYLAAWGVIRLLRPTQTKDQAKTVRAFVDALQKTSETVQTPKFIILFRLIKDILFPSKESYISELSSSASNLRSSLKEVIDLF